MLAVSTIRLKSIVPALVVGCLILVPLPAAATQGPEAQRESPQGEGGGWVSIQEWSGGPGQMRTEEFMMPAKVWRLSFKSTSGDRHGLMDILVSDENDEIVTASYSQQADDNGILSGSFLVRREPGTFRLQINSYGLQWQAVVERQE